MCTIVQTVTEEQLFKKTIVLRVAEKCGRGENMTENEIKEATFEDALHCAKALVGTEKCEECRFYRLCHTWCDDVYRLIVDALEEIQAYRAIGTVEEFKALKEKSEPKKIVYCKQSYGTPYFCPECNSDQIGVEFFSENGSEPTEKHTYCWKCGQKLDWSE